jgi:hypothetical protein
MERDEFYLVLASNVSPNTFPKNKPNHFYTPLCQSLVFNSNDRWTVALKEITYHYTLLSIVNESVEVWQDYPTLETWSLLDSATFTYDSTKSASQSFSSILVSGSIINNQYVMQLRRNVVQKERYAELRVFMVKMKETRL